MRVSGSEVASEAGFLIVMSKSSAFIREALDVEERLDRAWLVDFAG